MAGEPTGGGRFARPLPPIRWRAVLGAALVTTAAGGVLVAHRAADEPPSTRYLVATSELAAGHTLSRHDLGSVAIDLPGAVHAVAEDDVEQVVGRVVAHNLGELDLVRPDDLLARDRFTTADEQEVTVTLDAARAPVGSVHAGDTVRVLATAADGGGTRTLAEAVRVADIDQQAPGGSIGSTSGVRVRLAVPTPTIADLVVDAAVSEHLTIVLPSPTVADRP